VNEHAASGVLILAGQTASGKTEFALALAERYDAEIVGADSRQIYRDMPIGTAAPSAAQRARVPHHLIGFVDPYERYSAARYVEDAAAAIAEIHARGKRAIVAGGTGFYLRALCGDVALAREPDRFVRDRLAREAQTHPADVLHAWLAARAPDRARAISPNDPYRVTRALEVALTPDRDGDPPERVRLPTLRSRAIPFAKVALRISSERLAERIADRTQAMLDAGLIDEAERIGATAVAADAVGYREALAYSCGRLTLDELRRILARTTRRYAKRQLTWFRAEPGLRWIDAQEFAAIDALVQPLGWRYTPRTHEN
jgi:tRNA dimethylallyltransferase